MQDYNLLVLSPSEFESLSRDILQKKLNVFIESFTTGRDGGIDFRHTSNTSKTTIIQAKRYTDYSNLYSHLKKEKYKVLDLKPDRYILTTTVGLTPKNKLDIQNLFLPYKIETEDIIGKDDFNNLLGLYSEIERKYYKLWITSTNILEKILHSKIYNQSNFELDEIKDKIKLYVQNESFSHALSILNTNRYLIISGIPGIGKTTLARILIFFLLSKNFDEFIYLADSIDEGYSFFEENKNQIFFFDDFLGRNFFEVKDQPKVDSKIVKFIEKIKKTPNKILILTTREYILRQANEAFESFKVSNIELAKCVLDISSYTNIIKAQILYNHLYFSSIPSDYLHELIKDKKYHELIEHRNYNPRIIETIINNKIWLECSPKYFLKKLNLYFDNPESVWLHSYEKSLDKLSQYALLILLTLGTPVLLEDWQDAVIEFFTVNNSKLFVSIDSINFKRVIRELENTFIITRKDSYHSIVVEYQNPSIQDFLINYLKDNDELIKDLIISLKYSEQFFEIFTTDSNKAKRNKKIFINSKLSAYLTNRLIQVYSLITSSSVIRTAYTENQPFSWNRFSEFKYTFLLAIYEDLSISNSFVNDFVYSEFQKIIYIDCWSSGQQKAYVKLLSTLDLTKLIFDVNLIFESFVEQIILLDNFEIFSELKNIFQSNYNDFINSEKFRKSLDKFTYNVIKKVDPSDAGELSETLKTIEEKFNISYSEDIENLNEIASSYDSYIDAQVDSYIEDRRDSDSLDVDEMSEKIMIDQIFNSILVDT